VQNSRSSKFPIPEKKPLEKQKAVTIFFLRSLNGAAGASGLMAGAEMK
jgi:hypothetical protein